MESNTKEYTVMIDELNKLINVDRSMRVAVSSVLAMQQRRIFQEGQASNESKIGKYSNKPASISKKNQAKNTGKTYFKGGYAEYKSLIGRNPGFVILRNTDQMMRDQNMFVLGNNEYGIGFSNDINFDKTQWMESKYNKDIFDQTSKEGDKLEEILYLELDRIIK